MRLGLAIKFDALLAASGLAGSFSAINPGTALAFGQIAFALTAVIVATRRP